jgi:hypothetical protein
VESLLKAHSLQAALRLSTDGLTVPHLGLLLAAISPRWLEPAGLHNDRLEFLGDCLLKMLAVNGLLQVGCCPLCCLCAADGWAHVPARTLPWARILMGGIQPCRPAPTHLRAS